MGKLERDRGLELIRKMWGATPAMADDPSPLIKDTIEHLFGDLWQRPGLEVAERSLVTVAVLVALNREAELRLHLTAARRLGHSDIKLEALINHIAHYAGWPCGIAAQRALREVQNQPGSEPQ